VSRFDQPNDFLQAIAHRDSGKCHEQNGQDPIDHLEPDEGMRISALGILPIYIFSVIQIHTDPPSELKDDITRPVHAPLTDKG
jgi:hypothetical protein